MPRRDELEGFGAKLTRKLVDAVRTRIEHSTGFLSVRRALLYDSRAGVTDRDVAAWLARGSELDATGAEPESMHDELCVELARMDTARGGIELVRAGMAARRILDSRDPRAYGAQVRLIALLQQVFADPETGEARGVGVSQEDMDSLSTEQLARVEVLLAERARIARELESIVSSARRGRVAAGDDSLH